jgi:oligopeptide transport system ATP-binding protein
MKEKNTSAVDYSEKVLEVKNLRKYFFSGTGKNKLIVPAVDGVSFDVHKREVFGLVGESGCGKTTTGRTIIKLYTPTDGTVDLNGIRISSGYQGNQLKIKEIKMETKEKISSLNEYKKEIIKLEKEKEQKIRFINDDIDGIKKQQEIAIKKVSEPIENYKTNIYNYKNSYNTDIEKLEYQFHLKKHEILDKTKNYAEKEYDYELGLASNRNMHRLDALKESAALKKEVIKQRIAVQKEEYLKIKQELKEKYLPLIQEAEKDLLDKNDAKAQISALKKELSQNKKVRKEQYVNELKGNKKADTAKIIKEIKKIKESYKVNIDEKLEKISEIKQEYKNLIVDIKSKAKSVEVDKNKVNEIKEDAKQKIKEQKQIIDEIKRTNKSNEALLNSRKMQMIFQDPISSLNPRMTVKEIVGEGLIVLGGYSEDEINERVGKALELVGLSAEYGTRYPHEFSGGQRQRIGIARAIIMNPSVIIADEPISSLDVSIRAQVINLLTKLKKELGLTILFIAHDLSVVRFFCDRIAVMYYGKIVEVASSEELFKNPTHPYTISLLSAIPQPDPDYEKGRKRIDYSPSMHDYRIERPTLREIAEGHTVYANDKEFAEYQKKYNAANTPKAKKQGTKKTGGTTK